VEQPDLTVRGDSQAVRRLVINLLSNALRHAPRGTTTLDVRQRIENGHQWIELSVRDTGEGIPVDILQRLGRAFPCRGAGVRPDRKRGAGLGLAICRGIADAHGGYITVNSTVGNGSTFTVHFRGDLPRPIVRAPGANPRPITIVGGSDLRPE
jgi:NtrC-family two-component system sensor histidine kinase KinB